MFVAELDTRSPHRTMVVVVVTVLSCALFATAAAKPHAGTPPPVHPLSAHDMHDAITAAHSERAINIAKRNFRQGGKHPVPATISVADAGVAVYSLDADFVRAIPGAAPATFGYVAVTATAPDGRTSTMQVQRDGARAWTMSTVMSGNDEARLYRKLPTGTVLFREPQIDGWYALSSSHVQLLQAALPQNRVGEHIALADYQHQVHIRYGDKLPGSEYARNGGIGFQQSTLAPANEAAKNVPAPAADTSSALSSWWVAVSVSSLLGGLTVILRRRWVRARSKH